MNASLRPARWIAGAALLLLSALVQAHEVGWRSLKLPAGGALDEETTVALYYPTEAPPRPIQMGPFRVEAAIGAAPIGRYRGLLLFSHGLKGSELGHGRIAEGLARHGWLVAVMRHPHDNWQDDSLSSKGSTAYFNQRPRQASAVLDGLLSDPEIRDRLPTDALGVRVGALGHSAGGYTVLALAGARFDVSRLIRHCTLEAAEDPIFCGAGAERPTVGDTAPSSPSRRDPRVRAVAALAAVGAPQSDASLAGIAIPVAVYTPLRDTFLVPRFHGERVAQAIPGALAQPVENASHFAFMDTPSFPIPSPDGGIGFDPPGFDRAAFQRELADQLDGFFAKALESNPTSPAR